MLALTLESTPQAATHWSTREMAKVSGLSRASIHRIWQAFSLAVLIDGFCQRRRQSATACEADDRIDLWSKWWDISLMGRNKVLPASTFPRSPIDATDFAFSCSSESTLTLHVPLRVTD